MTRSARRRRPTHTVAGEDLQVLIRAFQRLRVEPIADWVLDDPDGQALIRAQARLEARLLLADATAYPGSAAVLDDEEQRGFRAVQELYARVAAAAKAQANSQRRSA